MYAHLFSVPFQKWRHGGIYICFLTPMIMSLFLAHISKIVQDRGLVTIIHVYILYIYIYI